MHTLLLLFDNQPVLCVWVKQGNPFVLDATDLVELLKINCCRDEEALGEGTTTNNAFEFNVSITLSIIRYTLLKNYQEFQELRNQHHIEVLKRHNVIGLTVTGAAIRANLLGELGATYPYLSIVSDCFIGGL